MTEIFNSWLTGICGLTVPQNLQFIQNPSHKFWRIIYRRNLWDGVGRDPFHKFFSLRWVGLGCPAQVTVIATSHRRCLSLSLPPALSRSLSPRHPSVTLSPALALFIYIRVVVLYNNVTHPNVTDITNICGSVITVESESVTEYAVNIDLVTLLCSMELTIVRHLSYRKLLDWSQSFWVWSSIVHWSCSLWYWKCTC